MKRWLVTCIECAEYPCERYVRRKWGMDQQSRVAQDNLERIKRVGLESWLEEQRERRLMVEELLANYNEGRSMSFCCLACTVMPIELLNEALAETKAMPLDYCDVKAKAKTLRSIIQKLPSKPNRRWKYEGSTRNCVSCVQGCGISYGCSGSGIECHGCCIR